MWASYLNKSAWQQINATCLRKIVLWNSWLSTILCTHKPYIQSRVRFEWMSVHLSVCVWIQLLTELNLRRFVMQTIEKSKIYRYMKCVTCSKCRNNARIRCGFRKRNGTKSVCGVCATTKKVWLKWLNVYTLQHTLMTKTPKTLVGFFISRNDDDESPCGDANRFTNSLLYIIYSTHTRSPRDLSAYCYLPSFPLCCSLLPCTDTFACIICMV